MDEGRSEYRPRRPELKLLHRAVREGWRRVAESVRLPRRVHEEVRRYLQCGDLRRGFTVVKCDECAQSQLVAFSCKSRAWCPSCGARRAHETAQHLDEVLPQVPFRQWTLSLPFGLRFLVVKEPKLLRAVERRLVAAIFRWQRARARGLGARGRRVGGAVCFTQLFGSAFQLSPHLHLLAAEGVWDDGVFMELPAPSPQEVEAVLKRTLEQLLPQFESREASSPPLPLRGRASLRESLRRRAGRLLTLGSRRRSTSGRESIGPRCCTGRSPARCGSAAAAVSAGWWRW